MFNQKHKCMKCGELATHQFTRIEKGQIVDLFLCDEHASQMSPYQAQKPKPLSEILEQLVKQNESGMKAGELASPPGLRCESCHLEYETYRRSLMLGCSDCYRYFREQLIPHLRRFHGDTRHCGRKPGGGAARPAPRGISPAQLAEESAGPLPKSEAAVKSAPPVAQDPSKLVADLKRVMMQAIAQEDYTKAAACRDQIRLIGEAMAKMPPAAK